MSPSLSEWMGLPEPPTHGYPGWRFFFVLAVFFGGIWLAIRLFYRP